MKFGKHLISVVDAADPEWALFFLNYKALKKILKNSVREDKQMIEGGGTGESGTCNGRGEIKKGGSGNTRRGREIVLASSTDNSESHHSGDSNKLVPERRIRDDGAISHDGTGTILNQTLPEESESNAGLESLVIPSSEMPFFRCKQ